MSGNIGDLARECPETLAHRADRSRNETLAKLRALRTGNPILTRLLLASAFDAVR
ncbi:hypothetical protein [Microbacterium testaceum]|uniref:hypothetical protein n=1 Tax=Microbacterium testaceum TaxID=2033 RepID=UPI0025B1D732|nr:hypothetical protein [Microbacterium testaceum]WJS89626.1 hypothetical protein NYQ11_09745 [Microbacterium testaceum]